MSPKSNLEEIAELIHEYRELFKKAGLSIDDKNRQRLSRLDHILSEITLTGEEILQMQDFDPLLLGDNDVKRSSIYEELKRDYDKLRGEYNGLELRYNKLVRTIEKLFGSQFELKELLNKQREEAYREG